MKKSLSMFWGLMTSAGAFAAPVAVNSTCTIDEAQLESSQVGATVLSVSGPLRFTANGPCEVGWTATRLVELTAGTYAVGQAFDFTYAVSTHGPGLLGMNMNTVVKHLVLGEAGGLGTGFGLPSNGSGAFYYAVDTKELGIEYPLDAGAYVLEQHVWINVTAELGSTDPFEMTVDMHFPQLSYVTLLPSTDGVPEPSTFALAAAAGLLLWRGRKRR